VLHYKTVKMSKVFDNLLSMRQDLTHRILPFLRQFIGKRERPGTSGNVCENCEKRSKRLKKLSKLAILHLHFIVSVIKSACEFIFEHGQAMLLPEKSGLIRRKIVYWEKKIVASGIAIFPVSNSDWETRNRRVAKFRH